MAMIRIIKLFDEIEQDCNGLEKTEGKLTEFARAQLDLIKRLRKDSQNMMDILNEVEKQCIKSKEANGKFSEYEDGQYSLVAMIHQELNKR